MISVCPIVGCGGRIKTKGYCDAHYKRLWRYGDPLGGEKFKRIPRGLPCSIEGCPEVSYKRGFCNAHYLRRRRYGRDHAIRRTEPNNCRFAHCPGRSAIDKHLAHVRDPDKFKSRAKRWAANNPDRVRKNWKAYQANNRHVVRAIGAKRRASLLRATPPWLTKEHWRQIKAIYAQAERLSIDTGVQYHVDHIVPLQGKTVCGLHVPWNLRAIPGTENNRRPRVWSTSEGAISN